MRLRQALATTAAGLSLAACASGTQSTTTSNEPARPTWSGPLQPTQQRTGGLNVTGQIKAFGNVTISASEGSLQRQHVYLTVAVPTTLSQQLRWAVLSGRCGNGDLALIGYDAFPLIDISSNGRGQVEADLPLNLDAEGSYHVNVYNGGQQLENVLTCANLKYNSNAPK